MESLNNVQLREISESFARAVSTDGLCGDVSHLKDCPIEQCAAPNILVLCLHDASFSIIHQVPARATTAGQSSPIVQAPTQGSVETVHELEERNEAERAAKRDGPPKGNRRRMEGVKQARFWAPPCTASTFCGSPALRRSRVPQSSSDNNSKSGGLKGLAPVHVEAFGKKITLQAGESTESIIRRLLEQSTLSDAEAELEDRPVPASASPRSSNSRYQTGDMKTSKGYRAFSSSSGPKTFAAHPSTLSDEPVRTTMPGTFPFEKAKAKASKLEAALKEAAETCIAAKAANEKKVASQKAAAEDDREVVGHCEEKKWVVIPTPKQKA